MSERGGEVAFWERVKKDTQEGMQVLKREASSSLNRGILEANFLLVKLQMNAVEKKVKNRYRELGKKVYEHMKKRGEISGDGEVKALIVEITELLSQREGLSRELQDIKEMSEPE